MTEIIYCPACKNSGRTNRCYVTGYDSKCGHDLGIAYTRFNNGSSIILYVANVEEKTINVISQDMIINVDMIVVGLMSLINKMQLVIHVEKL